MTGPIRIKFGVVIYVILNKGMTAFETIHKFLAVSKVSISGWKSGGRARRFSAIGNQTIGPISTKFGVVPQRIPATVVATRITQRTEIDKFIAFLNISLSL